MTKLSDKCDCGKDNIEKSLYPSTIFHFTEKYEDLVSIISDSSFKASYANETIVGLNAERQFGIPMVSFCDIRLSQLNEHTAKYGHFGIGLKKEWAIESGLNPVSYLNHKCSMFSYFNARIQRMSKNLTKIREEHGIFAAIYKREKRKYRDLINVMRYMKNYEGRLIRKGKIINENYRFANENEWRYVPDIRADLIPIKLVKNDSDSEWKIRANERLWKHEDAMLNFESEDIKYIFVPDQEMAIKLIGYLNKNIDDSELPLMISKIFISTQVFDDL